MVAKSQEGRIVVRHWVAGREGFCIHPTQQSYCDTEQSVSSDDVAYKMKVGHAACVHYTSLPLPIEFPNSQPLPEGSYTNES